MLLTIVGVILIVAGIVSAFFSFKGCIVGLLLAGSGGLLIAFAQVIDGIRIAGTSLGNLIVIAVVLVILAIGVINTFK